MKCACLALLAVLCATASLGAQQAIVTAERTIVRAEPRAGAGAIATVTLNTVIDILGTEGTWVRVRVRETGAEGYMPASFVRATGTSPAAALPTPADPPPGSSSAPPPPPGAAPAPTRTFLGRAFGGVWSASSSSGLQAGGGIAIMPFANPALEISGDGSLVRVAGTQAFSGSANVAFNFILPGRSFTPFAGGGLAIVHQPGQQIAFDVAGVPFQVRVGSATSAALQLLGGVDFPVSDRRAVRGELRIQVLSGGTSVAALAGMSF